MIDYLKKKDLYDPVIVAPDAGGVGAGPRDGQAVRCRSGHHRQAARGAELRGRHALIGDVKGRDAIVIAT